MISVTSFVVSSSLLRVLLRRQYLRTGASALKFIQTLLRPLPAAGQF